MKKILAFLSVFSVITLSACASGESSEKEIITETIAADESSSIETQTELHITDAQDETNNLDLQSCTVETTTFSVPAEWLPLANAEGTFTTNDENIVYQLQGESHLGSITPKEFFDRLVEGYSENYDVSYYDNQLDSIIIADHVEAEVGRIEMTINNVVFSIDVLCIPQKNKAITFAAQAAAKEDIKIDIREITKTTKINIGNKDYITGNTFIASDNSRLCLNDDMSFIYYQSKDSDDVYCDGKYEVYYGQNAIDRVVSMTEYGVTKEELELVLNAGMDGYTLNIESPIDLLKEKDDNELFHVCKDTFYAVILHNENLVDNGNTSPMGNDTLYIGYYLPDHNFADMTNAVTAGYVSWALEE